VLASPCCVACSGPADLVFEASGDCPEHAATAESPPRLHAHQKHMGSSEVTPHNGDATQHCAWHIFGVVTYDQHADDVVCID